MTYVTISINIGTVSVQKKSVRIIDLAVELEFLYTVLFQASRSPTCMFFLGTLTWNNTVSAVITTHRKLFKSNRKQSGYWTLRPTTPGARTESDSDDDDELLNLDEGGISALTKKKPPKQKRASTAPSSSLGYSGSPGHKKRAHSDMSEGYGPGGNGGGGRRNVYRFEPRIPFSARRRHRQNPSYRTAMVILAENVAANGDTQPISDSTPMESNNPDTVSDQPLPSSTAASSLSGGGDFSGSASGGGANASRKLRSSTSEEDPLYIVPVPPHWVERIQRHPFLTATFASNDILIPSWRSVDVDDETVPADEGEEEEEVRVSGSSPVSLFY
jgi:hypothetical protein